MVLVVRSTELNFGVGFFIILTLSVDIYYSFAKMIST